MVSIKILLVMADIHDALPKVYILDLEKGLSLKIFDPAHGKWWELK